MRKSRQPKRERGPRHVEMEPPAGVPVHYDRDGILALQGDMREVLAGMEEGSFSACVTDPPYGLEFMGKEWDHLDAGLPQENVWKGRRGKGGSNIGDDRTRPGSRHRVGFSGKRNGFKRCTICGKRQFSGSPCKCKDPDWKIEYPDGPPSSSIRMQRWWELHFRAVYRVLKPGAFLLVFGGTRTYHRMACAVEDAGFEIRDTCMYLYGCLSEDTEILLDGRWEPYHKAVTNKHVMCYNIEDGTFSWQPVQEVVTYDYDDTAYRIRSDSTDQIVSRNHRCIVEQGGREVFQLAEDAALECEARIPVLEDVQDLLKAVPYVESHAGSQKRGVLDRLSCYINKRWTKKEASTGPCGYNRDHMCSVREESMACAIPDTTGCEANVFPTMQRRTTRSGVGEARIQGACRVDRGVAQVLPQEDVRPEQSRMEGRRNILQEARQLPTNQVCTMPTEVQEDGAQRRVYNGASSGSSAHLEAMFEAERSGAPHQSRSERQPSEKLTTLQQQQIPQTLRAPRYTSTTLAGITSLHYKGVMWCVRVPTGAFVARRNGKVFVTGNSGFPKSLAIDKAIDRAAGADREVVGVRSYPREGTTPVTRKASSIMTPDGHQNVKQNSNVVTAPATPQATLWQGYGTALKPAWEPILVAQKPNDGSFAHNALTHGVGGLNVDGCRVGWKGGKPSQEEWNRLGSGGVAGAHGHAGQFSQGLKDAYADGKIPVLSGRWPANLLLSHSEQCVCVGTHPTRGVQRAAGHNKFRPGDGIPDDGYEMGEGRVYVPDGETEVWACVPGCAVRILDTQSGIQKDGTAVRRHVGKRCGSGVVQFNQSNPDMRDDVTYGGGGGASRFFFTSKASTVERSAGLEDRSQHPTVKPLDLMRYLITLVTYPTQNLILDPFAGSGSTLVAAKRLGIACIGIEKEVEYCTTIAGRLSQRTKGGLRKWPKLKRRRK